MSANRSKNTIFVLIAVAVIGIASAGAYLFLTNDDNDNESVVGNYSEYLVYSNTHYIIGHMKTTAVEETPESVNFESKYKIYEIIDGNLELILMESEDITKNKNEEESHGESTGREIISTKWGPTGVNVYVKEIDGGLMKTYVGDNGTVYKMDMYMPGINFVYELFRTNLF